MKSITTFILLLSTAFAFSDVAGFLTKEAKDWKFVQSVGGMKVSIKDTALLVECDVSGTKKVTVKPTMVNSALGVRKVFIPGTVSPVRPCAPSRFPTKPS